MSTKLEHCQIHPSASIERELSLSLTHFDIPFLQLNPTQRLIFFDFPSTKSYFMETIVPDLKKSLAITLTHFLPLAGNIIFPLDSTKPVARYSFGDSFSLTIAQCDKDFDYLAGNPQRVANEFYTCVPQLPPARCFADSVLFPVIALQITLFSERGICIGLTNYHAAGDESSIVNFVKTWALVNRLGGDFHLIDGKSLPVFDRSLVQDLGGLDSGAWNSVKKSGALPVERPPLTFPINRVRATFILIKYQVQYLKNNVLANKANLHHISSFSIICAYAWTCSIKSVSAAGEEVSDDEPVYFASAADCRGRLSSPLPSTYFGNCVIFVIAESKYGLLKGIEGFLIAAECIGKAIRKTVYGENGILDGADWPLDFGKFSEKQLISVAGSPRFDVYEADFGWGPPKKYEFVHLEGEKSISLCKSKDFKGGFEIGLSRKKFEMDAFETVFNQGLHDIMKV